MDMRWWFAHSFSSSSSSSSIPLSQKQYRACLYNNLSREELPGWLFCCLFVLLYVCISNMSWNDCSWQSQQKRPLSLSLYLLTTCFIHICIFFMTLVAQKTRLCLSERRETCKSKQTYLISENDLLIDIYSKLKQ